MQKFLFYYNVGPKQALQKFKIQIISKSLINNIYLALLYLQSKHLIVGFNFTNTKHHFIIADVNRRIRITYGLFRTEFLTFVCIISGNLT